MDGWELIVDFLLSDKGQQGGTARLIWEPKYQFVDTLSVKLLIRKAQNKFPIKGHRVKEKNKLESSRQRHGS